MPLSSSEITPPIDPAALTSRYVPSYPFPRPGRLVGRDAEVKALEWLLARGQGAGQTLFVSAPAGTGKSTLVGTLARHAARLGVLVLAGGGYESDALVPLRPFRDALGDYLLSRPAESVRADFAAIEADLAAFIPELRHHLGLSSASADAAALDQTRAFGAVHTLLRDLAERAPVLVCLEDLRVADALTLDLLQYIVRQVHHLPITILATLRSDEVLPGQGLAQLLTLLARQGAERLELPPLGLDDTGRLASTLLDGPASRPLVQSLFDTTEGNPLFVEQLLLAMREEHRLDHVNGVWRSTGDVQSEVPSFIRDVILRRVDRLSADCRATLSLMATIGQTVDHAVLVAAAAPRAELDLLGDLDEALATRVLEETDTGYRFDHAIVRHVMYRRLTSARRMLLHARVADALERLFATDTLEHAAELAYHFALSGHDPALRAKALHYSLEAGRRAAALSSHNAALAHFRRAYQLLERDISGTDVRTRLDVLQSRGIAEQNLGLWEPASTASASSWRSLRIERSARVRTRPSADRSISSVDRMPR